jgi:predicted transcriptional regulator
MSRSQVQVHVGERMADIGARFIDGWRRMERGKATNEKHISFETWETMGRVLSPRRLELLRRLHRHPAKSIRALSQALNRNYWRVHEDVEALVAAGLLDRDDEGLRAGYDSFAVTMQMVL